MSIKKDLLQLTTIFVILIILLIFGGYYLILEAYFRGFLLIGSMVPLFILMVLKGKRMKKKYPEEYE